MNKSRNPCLSLLFLSADRHIKISVRSNSQCGMKGIQHFRIVILFSLSKTCDGHVNEPSFMTAVCKKNLDGRDCLPCTQCHNVFISLQKWLHIKKPYFRVVACSNSYKGGEGIMLSSSVGCRIELEFDRQKAGCISGVKTGIINQQTALLGIVNLCSAEGHHLSPSPNFRHSM